MYNGATIKKGILFTALFVTVVVTAIAMVVKFLGSNAPAQNSPVIDNSQEVIVPEQVSYSGWLEYFNPTIGLKMFYPPQFKNYQGGSLSSKITPGLRRGAYICINLSNCISGQESAFEIRSTSLSWESQKYEPVFLDNQGYYFLDGDYIVKLLNGDQVVLSHDLAEELMLKNQIKTLIVNGQSGPQSNLLFPKPGWIGAIINTDFPDYSAIVVQMQITSDLSRDLFIHILNSFQFPWITGFPTDQEIQAEVIPPRFFDPDMKKDLLAISNNLNCRYLISGRYPSVYFPDHACGKSQSLINGVTQMPYHYQPIADGQDYLLKTKLSSGEIYTLNRSSNPPPTPTPTPRYRR